MDAIFAVVEIAPSKNNARCDDTSLPALTIRMHPSAVPDTRNYIWSSRLDIPTVAGSGEMLYFTSGFLSLQFEFQSFLKLLRSGASYQRTAVFDQNAGALPASSGMQRLALALGSNLTVAELHHNFMNVSQPADSPVHVPFYMRAFQMKPYTEEVFWRTFGFIIAIAMALFVTLPSAIIAGQYREEHVMGLKDVLSTIPGLSSAANAMAWVISSWFVVLCLTCKLLAMYTLH